MVSVSKRFSMGIQHKVQNVEKFDRFSKTELNKITNTYRTDEKERTLYYKLNKSVIHR